MTTRTFLCDGDPDGFYLACIHYRRELIRCGKAACKSCPHGPYWYAYSRRGAFLRKTYIGKKLPKDIIPWAPEWVKAHG